MRRLAGGLLAFTGMALFLAGFYLFPAGADLFYAIVINSLGGGDYGAGMRWIYILCVGMIVLGLVLWRGPEQTFAFFRANPMITGAFIIAILLGFYLFPELGGYA